MSERPALSKLKARRTGDWWKERSCISTEGQKDGYFTEGNEGNEGVTV
jgi:hypothetical protein